MTGRPINQSRQIAIEFGLKSYEGKPCKRCGNTERYLRGGCIHCGRAIATEQREARKYFQMQAKAALDTPQEMVVEDTAEAAEARRQADIDELM